MTEVPASPQPQSAVSPANGTVSVLIFLATLIALFVCGIGAWMVSSSASGPCTVDSNFNTVCVAGPWASSGKHWWGLAIIAIGAVVAICVAMVAVIAKGVELGHRLSR